MVSKLVILISTLFNITNGTKRFICVFLAAYSDSFRLCNSRSKLSRPSMLVISLSIKGVFLATQLWHLVCVG